jgi:AraC family transcriptional regulator
MTPPRITVTERTPVRVACQRYTGPFGEPLGRFWRVIVTPWLAEHGLLDCPRYGVTLDDPRVTPPERCRYDVCVELPAGLTLPDAIEATIAGGRYAVSSFKGTSAQIGAAWNGFVPAAAVYGKPDPARHPYEHYPRGAAFDSRTGMFSCELCLPLLGGDPG